MKQAIASMSQTQYDAIIEMSNNDGVKTPFETIKLKLIQQVMMIQ